MRAAEDAIKRLRDRATALSGEIEAGAQALAREFPAFADLSSPEPLPAAAAQQLLRGDEAVVSFASYYDSISKQHRGMVFAVTSEGLAWGWMEDAGSLATLSRSVRCSAVVGGCRETTRPAARVATRGMVDGILASPLRAAAEEDVVLPAVSGEGGFDVAAAHALYQKLLGPVAERLKGKRHLIIVGDGTLAGFPFHLQASRASTKPNTRGLNDPS